jgi:hypothetical protein
MRIREFSDGVDTASSGPLFQVTKEDKFVFNDGKPTTYYYSTKNLGNIMSIISHFKETFFRDALTRVPPKYEYRQVPVYRIKTSPYCRYLASSREIKRGEPCRPIIRYVNKKVRVKRNSREFPMKECKHTKIEQNILEPFVFKPYIYRVWEYSSYTKTRTYQIPVHTGAPLNAKQAYIPTAFPLSSLLNRQVFHHIDINNVYRSINDQMKNFAPDLAKTEANLFVTTIEYKTFLSAFAINGVRALGPLGLISSYFLQWNFALKPTIDDYNKIRNMSKTIKRKIDVWNAKAGKVQYFHIDIENLNESYTSNESSSPLQWNIGVDSSMKSHATVAVIGNRIPYPTNLDYMSQLGFDKPLAALWEIIPFSFVVDWLIGLSSFIEQLESVNTPAHFKVVDACYTSHLECITTASNFRTSTNYQFSSGSIYRIEKDFRRTILNTDLLNDREFLASIGAYMPSSRFGVKQALLSTALLITLNPRLGRM